MTHISIPLSRSQNFIGKLGEKLVEEYFKQNDIYLVTQEYNLGYINSRADFIVTKNKDKYDCFWEKITEIDEQTSSDKISDAIVLEEFKGKKYVSMSHGELRALRDKMESKYPHAALHYLGDENSLKFYDLRYHLKMGYEYIRNNFCIVEVKTSGLGKYPITKGHSMTLSQTENKYYDHILRVKLDRNFEHGFSRTIHPDDIVKLQQDPKLL